MIDYVAAFSRGLNVLEGVPTEHICRRGLALLTTVAILGVGIALYPQYAATFLARLAMSNRHYPTRTQIDEVQVNGTVLAADESSVSAGYGVPINFAVRISGELPDDVKRINLRSVASGAAQPIELAQASKSADGQMVFKGHLPQLVDSLDFTVYVGDAWTEPARLEVIPLPIVEPKLTSTPPLYARAAAAAVPGKGAGSLQLSVLEGSRVDLEINCANKALTAAAVTVEKTDFNADKKAVTQTKSYPLVKQDDEGRRWSLTARDTPLARIDGLTKYRIQVTDINGIGLPHPLEGSIHIKPDRPPTVMAAADVQYFLPNTGVPEIKYSANDDYGISALQMHVELIHPGTAADAASDSATDAAQFRVWSDPDFHSQTEADAASAQAEPAAHRSLSPPVGAI